MIHIIVIGICRWIMVQISSSCFRHLLLISGARYKHSAVEIQIQFILTNLRGGMDKMCCPYIHQGIFQIEMGEFLYYWTSDTKYELLLEPVL